MICSRNWLLIFDYNSQEPTTSMAGGFWEQLFKKDNFSNLCYHSLEVNHMSIRGCKIIPQLNPDTDLIMGKRVGHLKIPERLHSAPVLHVPWGKQHSMELEIGLALLLQRVRPNSCSGDAAGSMQATANATSRKQVAWPSRGGSWKLLSSLWLPRQCLRQRLSWCSSADSTRPQIPLSMRSSEKGILGRVTCKSPYSPLTMLGSVEGPHRSWHLNLVPGRIVVLLTVSKLK